MVETVNLGKRIRPRFPLLLDSRRSNMRSMDYLLRPAEKILKRDVRSLLEREGAGFPAEGKPGRNSSAVLLRKIEAWIAGVLSERNAKAVRLSAVESVLVLEEIFRRIPAKDVTGSLGAMFQSAGPRLRHAAVLLGGAQGALASHGPTAFGSAREKPKEAERRILGLADIFGEIESARLAVYRAAILEDDGKNASTIASAAEKTAKDLASKAEAWSSEFQQGERPNEN